MAICPTGHTSSDPEYCDVCGERIGGAPAPSGPQGAAPVPTMEMAPPSSPTRGVPAGTPCPDCGTPAVDRFCEQCGYDFVVGGGRPTPASAPLPPPTPTPTPPPAPSTGSGVGTGWVAWVTADRAYYDTMVAEEGPDAASIAFPPYAPERRIPLNAPQIRIGRRSSSTGAVPEIDLREPPEDPGVSHVHAVLLAKPDGTWTVVDPGSTNRTCLNGSTEPIPFNVEVPVAEGDRIHVGAWTTITLRRGEAT
jgi:hypothetical protein